MRLIAKKPCSFGGRQFFIGDEIPENLVADAKRQEEYGVINIVNDGEGGSGAQSGSLFTQEQVEKMIAEAVEEAEKKKEDQLAEMKSLIEGASSQMSQIESLKADLSEKVHSENVKCYRNIQDLFGEFDERLEKVDDMEGEVGRVGTFVKFLTVFSIINFVALVGLIILSLDIINF